MPVTIFVLERDPYWTPELQRQFLATDITVRGCRKWLELTVAIHATPQSIAVIHYDDYAAECLMGLTALRDVPLIAVSSLQYVCLEYVLRDAGIAAFFADLPTGEQLARCCRRWFS